MKNFEFIEKNVNPKKRKVGDCVVRAIAEALNMSWTEVYDGLCTSGRKKFTMPNDKKCFEDYLVNIKGCTRMKMPKDENGKRYTIQRFAKEIAKPNTTYIILVANHLTCLKCGRIVAKLVDSWDCSYKSVGNYYIVNK